MRSNSPMETYAFAKRMGENLSGGEVLALDGDLGAGKTAFVKGLAKGLGIEEMVVSPTFTIVREYGGEKKLAHFDVYRIADPDEMFEIGFEEYLGGEWICVIEWAERIRDLLPQERLEIKIVRQGEGRQFFVRPGKGYEALSEVFEK